MPHYRISEAARLLGVSDDTVRRWVDQGHLSTRPGGSGRAVIDGVELARWAQQHAHEPQGSSGSSARNRFHGIVTAVTVDGVMAQVDLQCGPYRVVSLISAEAAADLGLEVGTTATASVKATTVVIEREER